ncbi:hypothetical protein N7478_003434 [Penicillium angulare]|uniref:uncharacterized protein n=1 Tax=Penicillium angulare TaxID=116970 RepID=UPI002542312F|nr:uncharacterized protein N7478_003434 [Penicillium angulare]KAJ5287748.1 hypothetical protein N7478_003434 [Penicillium angulare]
MSDSRNIRGESSKRKSHHGSTDLAPRKKHHRATTDNDEDVEMGGFGSDDGTQAHSSHNSKAKFAPRDDKEFTSVNDLKRRIRDVKRLLNKGRLPADARVVQERALAGYEQDLAEETARRDRSHLITKYHFVRFLDRKTATKNLNRLLRREKEKDLDSKHKARLQQKIHDARVNLNYTIYYPLTEKYLSLYPKSEEKSSAEAEEDSESEGEGKKHKKEAKAARPPLWSVVDKCMAEDTLDLLREGKLNIGHDGKPNSAVEKAKPVQHGDESKKPKKEVKKDVKKDNRKDNRKDVKKDEPQEIKQGTRRERRAALNDAPNGRKDKQNRMDYGRERDRLQDVAVQHAGDDSDGGFFDE